MNKIGIFFIKPCITALVDTLMKIKNNYKKKKKRTYNQMAMKIVQAFLNITNNSVCFYEYLKNTMFYLLFVF